MDTCLSRLDGRPYDQVAGLQAGALKIHCDIWGKSSLRGGNKWVGDAAPPSFTTFFFKERAQLKKIQHVWITLFHHIVKVCTQSAKIGSISFFTERIYKCSKTSTCWTLLNSFPRSHPSLNIEIHMMKKLGNPNIPTPRVLGRLLQLHYFDRLRGSPAFGAVECRLAWLAWLVGPMKSRRLWHGDFLEPQKREFEIWKLCCVGFFICNFCKIQKLFLAQVDIIC
jgi:hypothetical protein